MRRVSKSFQDCTKGRRVQKALFTAPYDEKVVDKLKEGDQIELHPAISEFQHVWKTPASGTGYASTSKIGKVDYTNLSKLRSENATNSPISKVKLMNTEQTKATLRDFRLNTHLYKTNDEGAYSRTISDDPKPKKDPFKSFEADVLKGREAITVGDVLGSLLAEHQQDAPLIAQEINFKTLESEILYDSGPEIVEEDEGWGSQLDQTDHFKRLKREEWWKKICREYSNDTAVFMICFIGDRAGPVMYLNKFGELYASLRVFLLHSLVSKKRQSQKRIAKLLR